LNLFHARIVLRAAVTFDAIKSRGQLNQPAPNAQKISVQWFLDNC
jgi:hypothetical protein